jgi:glycosyltransferase involved in cell wall biosynthesis
MGQFARLLPDFGWDVTVITGKHTGIAGLDRAAAESVQGRARVIEAWSPSSAVSVRGKPMAKTGIKGFVRRALRTAVMTVMFPDREILWVPAAISAARKALRETHHDAVLATHGPASDLIVGRALAKEFELPLVVDFRDLWSTLPMPIFTTPVHRAAARRLEHTMVRNASRLIAVAPKMAEDLADTHGFERERAIAITNGFDPADVSLVRDERRAGPFRLLYSGSVHAHYNLDPLWAAVRELAAAGTITPESFRIEFVGNLSMNDVRSHGVEPFVETSPFVAHDQVFATLARADALLVVETPGYYARYGYAAKVFDYVLTGKPVVALVEEGGNTARLLDAIGVAYRAEPTDASGIRRAVEKVLATKGDAPRRVDHDAAPFRDFNRKHLVEKLASVLDEVIATEPRGRW